MIPACSRRRTLSATLVAERPIALPISEKESRPFLWSAPTIEQSIRSRARKRGLFANDLSSFTATKGVFRCFLDVFRALVRVKFGHARLHAGDLRNRAGTRSRRSSVAV